jgi:peptidoglycan/LPS O-acetylase OafA/YrhL
MKIIPRASVWSAMSFLLCMLVAAAISVYGFDEYERAWGRGGSFQVLSWIAAATSVAVCLLAAFGFRVAHVSSKMNPKLAGSVVGVGTAVVVLVSFVITPEGWDGSALIPMLGLCMVVFGLAYSVGKVSESRSTNAV